MILNNKVILITGASRGIGFSVADICLKEGASVVANYRTEPLGLISLQETYGSDRVLTLKADVSVPSEVASMMNEIHNTHHSLDGIVCNAGIITRTPNWKDFPMENWEIDFKTNLIGVWNTIRYGVDLMLDGGSVVNVSSIYAAAPEAQALPYSMSKASVNAMTLALSKELSPRIRINSVLPGNTLTNMVPDRLIQNIIEEKTLLKRSADAYEIANTIVFLLSDNSSYITGSLIEVDGGFHIL